MDKTILITGGCGFVGSNLALFFKTKYPDYSITVLDNLRRRGSELNITRLTDLGIRFIHGDIRNQEDLEQVGDVDLLIEASSEPSVLAGITDQPDYLINTNLNGTIHCLQYASKHRADFIFLSSSRVYPIRLLNSIGFTESPTRFDIHPSQTIPGVSMDGINENFPLDGARSFYGASKLASELLIREFTEFYGMKTVINRCGVIAGPYQMGKVDQGVVVHWVASHFWKRKLGYFGYGGEGKQVRDLLHIRDLFRLIDHQAHHMELFSGETFNAGGGKDGSISLQELTCLCRDVTGNSIVIDKVVENRAADIRLYITDNTKITSLSGWKPEIGPGEIVRDIFDWILKDQHLLKGIIN